MGYLKIPLVFILFNHIDTNYINQSFWGKYPYHKDPDMKHSGRQRDLKAPESQ